MPIWVAGNLCCSAFYILLLFFLFWRKFKVQVLFMRCSLSTVPPPLQWLTAYTHTVPLSLSLELLFICSGNDKTWLYSNRTKAARAFGLLCWLTIKRPLQSCLSVPLSMHLPSMCYQYSLVSSFYTHAHMHKRLQMYVCIHAYVAL